MKGIVAQVETEQPTVSNRKLISKNRFMCLLDEVMNKVLGELDLERVSTVPVSTHEHAGPNMCDASHQYNITYVQLNHSLILHTHISRSTLVCIWCMCKCYLAIMLIYVHSVLYCDHCPTSGIALGIVHQAFCSLKKGNLIDARHREPSRDVEALLSHL